MLKKMISYSRVALPLLIGVCIGIALSLVILPFLEEQSCERNSVAGNQNDSEYRKHHFLHGVDFESFRNSEFQPHVIKSKQSEAQPFKKPVRNRFAQSEIDMKNFVFIGYLTSVQQLTKRGAALNKTLLTSRGDEKLSIKFFVDSSKQSNLLNHHPVVPLNLLNSNTLPLLTIKYLANQNYNRYKYYIIVPDTVFTIASTIRDVLQYMENEDYLGFQPSMTRSGSECDLKSGFIISHRTVMKIAEKITDCEHVFKITADAVEAMDKCVRLAISKSCTTRPVSMDLPLAQYRLTESDDGSRIDIPFDSLIVSGIDSPNQIYRIRRVLAQKDMDSTVMAIGKLRKHITKLFEAVDIKPDWPPAVTRQFQTTNRYDVIRWTLISDNTSYLEYDLVNSQRLEGDYLVDLNDMVKAIMSHLNSVFQRYTLVNVLQAYRREDPLRGIEYLVTITLRDSIRDLQQTKLFELLKPAGTFQMVPLRSNPDSTPVHIVVPVCEATVEDVKALLDNFVEQFSSDPNVAIHVALVYSMEELKNYQTGRTDVFKDVKKYITDCQNQVANGKMINLDLVLEGDKLSVIEVIAQTLTKISSESIVFTSTLSTELYDNIIHRVRANVIKGEKAYAPIAFWKYKPELINAPSKSGQTDIARAYGQFSNLWFDHLAFFVGDFLKVWKGVPRRFTAETHKLLSTLPGLSVFRAPDPDCIVRYRQMDCPRMSLLDQKTCNAQKFNNVGSGPTLAMKLLRDGILTDNL